MPGGLPFEMLLVIMEVSPQWTIAKMMRTCHALREDGARFLLGGGVSLTAEDSIISFVQFMRADPASRFQHLRVLKIASRKLHMGAADELLWLITCPMLALDSLTLCKAESVLASTLSPSELIHDGDSDGFAIALAQLRTLQHLKLGQCGQLARRLIRTICSPLQTIHIDFPSDGPGNGDEAENRNPIVLLAKHSETLQEISGSNFAMRPPWQFLYEAVFPSVRKINATYHAIWCPRTLSYIDAFPNLTHLSLTSAIPDGPAVWRLDGNFPLSRALRRRSWNRSSLEARHRKGWKNLQELEGDVTDVLALGLACHVPMLRLTGTILPKSLEYQHVADILEDTRPAGLAITIAGASTFGDAVGSLFRGPYAQQLRTLEVELVFSASEGDGDIQTVVNDVATTLALLPLHCVTLTLNYGLLTAPDQNYRSRYGWFCPMERDVENLDVVATQTVFRAAIPSLTADIAVRISKDRMPHTSRLGAVGVPDDNQ